MYENGRGVPQDYAEAVKCYRHAAEQGNSGAQFNLGLMYDSGRGVAQDHAEAVKWFRLAAEQGHASAQNNLGFMYAPRRPSGLRGSGEVVFNIDRRKRPRMLGIFHAPHLPGNQLQSA